MQPAEGRRPWLFAADLPSRRPCTIAARTQHVNFRFVGQVELMRTTFGGLGVALGLAVVDGGLS